MARLIPALPRFTGHKEEVVGLALEGGLSDDFIVSLPRSPDNATFIVLHPDLGAAVIRICAGAHRWDVDAQSWFDADDVPWACDAAAESLLKSLREALGDAIAGCPVVPMFVFPDGLTGPEHPSLCRSTSAGDLAQRLRDLMEGAVGEWRGGDEWAERLLQVLTPGASPYQRGAIPKAQADWRARQIAAKEASVLPADHPVRKVNDAAILRLTEMCMEDALAGRTASVAGLDLTAADLADPSFLLPAILIAASEDWAPVVASRGGRGGFLIRLSRDPNALLGYRVEGVTPSAALLLFIPVVNLMHKSIANGECILDDAVARFARWLRERDLDGFDLEIA